MDEKIIGVLSRPVEPRTRKGKGGLEFKYVKASDVIDVLNEAFGYEWSSEILETKKEDGYIITRVRLSVNLKDKDGAVNTVYKEAYGGVEIKKKSYDGSFVDLSNDYKTAMVSAIKKAAEQFGIALHLDDYYSSQPTNKKSFTPTSYKRENPPTPNRTDVSNPKAESSTTIKVSKKEVETVVDDKVLQAKKLLEGLSAPSSENNHKPKQEDKQEQSSKSDGRPKEFPKSFGSGNSMVNDMQMSAINKLCTQNGKAFDELLKEAIDDKVLDKRCAGLKIEELEKQHAVDLIKYLVSPKTAE